MPYSTLENLLRPIPSYDDAAILSHMIEIPLDIIDVNNKSSLNLLVINCYSTSQKHIDDILTPALLIALIKRNSPDLIFIKGLKSEAPHALHTNLNQVLSNLTVKFGIMTEGETVLCLPTHETQTFDLKPSDKSLHYHFLKYYTDKNETRRKHIEINLFSERSSESILPYQVEHKVHTSLSTIEAKSDHKIALFITDCPGTIGLYRLNNSRVVLTAKQHLVFSHFVPSPYSHLSLLDHETGSQDCISPQIHSLANLEHGLQRLLGGILTQCRWRFEGAAQEMCILMERNDRSKRFIDHVAKELGLNHEQRQPLVSSQDEGLVFESIFVLRTQPVELYTAILSYPLFMSAMLLKWIKDAKEHMYKFPIGGDRYHGLVNLETKLQQRRFQATAGILSAIDAWKDQYAPLLTKIQEKPKELREQSWKHLITLKLHELHQQSLNISEAEQKVITLWSPGNPYGHYVDPRTFTDLTKSVMAQRLPSSLSSSSSSSTHGSTSSSSSSSLPRSFGAGIDCQSSFFTSTGVSSQSGAASSVLPDQSSEAFDDGIHSPSSSSSSSTSGSASSSSTSSSLPGASSELIMTEVTCSSNFFSSGEDLSPPRAASSVPAEQQVKRLDDSASP